VGSDWLRVRGMEGTISDVVEVYCTVISRDILGGLKRSTKCLGRFSHQHTSIWEDFKYETEMTGLEEKL